MKKFKSIMGKSTKKSSKQILFERMHTIGGMPLNEHEVNPEMISKAAEEFSNYDESPSYQVKLDNIIKSATELHEFIKNFDELPAWVQDKITISEHNMDAITDWIKSLAHEEGEEHGGLGEGKGDPCWSDYEQIGMKNKDGKEVPNCVPKK